MLDHIVNLGDNKTMDIVSLTHKTEMLMALVSASQGAELQEADIANLVDRYLGYMN